MNTSPPFYLHPHHFTQLEDFDDDLAVLLNG
jgi:hypothetical protein